MSMPAILLRSHPFLDGIPAEYVDRLAPFSEPRTYAMNDRIIAADEPADACYLLNSGRVAIELADPRHGHLVVQTLGGGSVLGWSWLVPPYRWTFDARAVELTEVVAVAGPRLREVCEEHPGLGYLLLKRLAAMFGERIEATAEQLRRRMPDPPRADSAPAIVRPLVSAAGGRRQRDGVLQI